MPNNEQTAGVMHYVESTVGGDISTEDAEALLAWYTALASAVARFPSDDLKGVEPPLMSTPR